MPFFMTRTFFWTCPFRRAGRRAYTKGTWLPQGGVKVLWRRSGTPIYSPGLTKAARLARGDSNFTSETARIAAGRPKAKSLAPLRAVLPFLRPYRGGILLAGLALLAS